MKTMPLSMPLCLLGVGLLAGGAHAADLCEPLREQIEVRIAATGATGFAVVVVDANAEMAGKVVGTCAKGASWSMCVGPRAALAPCRLGPSRPHRLRRSPAARKRTPSPNAATAPWCAATRPASPERRRQAGVQPSSLNDCSGASGVNAPARLSFIAAIDSRTCALLQIAPCSQPIWRRLSSTEWSRA